MWPLSRFCPFFLPVSKLIVTGENTNSFIVWVRIYGILDEMNSVFL